jgi:ribosomal protein L37E
MTKQLKCLRFGCSRLYSVRREKKRCSSCGYEWIPGKLSLHLTWKEWSKILHWFLRGLPVVAIAQETGIERKRLLVNQSTISRKI